MAWEASGAVFSGYRAPGDCQLGAENRKKMQNNQHDFLMIFRTRCFFQKMFENGCQKLPQIDAEIIQNRFHKGAETKIRKSMKNDNTPSF